ncbi:MAG: pyrroloquinoline quinone-dependent dehydrogenase [Gemmatimonadaceae bacterium]
MRPTAAMRHQRRTALIAAAVAAACVRMGPQPPASPPRPIETTVTVVPTAADWISYNGNHANDRFSPLADITTTNVGQLRRVCTYDTGDTTSFQVGPVAMGGVIYVTTHHSTYAIDGETCALQWKHTRAAPPGFLRVNRGVAYADGRVFRGSTDARLYALDADDGQLLWDIPLGDPRIGESTPMAPIVWNDLVFVGTAGGDNFGVRARVYAIEAATGRQVWQFETVPQTGPAAQTWLRRSRDNPPTGGGMWTSLTVDTLRGVLYVPTGNPAPDFVEHWHPGENLYTTGILALDTRSGRLLGFVQPIKNDYHDWDIAAAPALITTRGGRSMLAVAAKDGFLYGIDRTAVDQVAAFRRERGLSGVAGGDVAAPGSRATLYGLAGRDAMTVRYRTPTTTHFNTTARFSSRRDTRFCPGTQGGTEWGGPAYDASLNLLFVNAVDWCTTVRLARLDTLRGRPGAPWTGEVGGGFGRQDPKQRWQGWLTAIDADNGAVRWKYRSATPLLAPVTATAGGVLFTGDLNGTVLALDARTGRVLWFDTTGQAIGAGITPYAAGGRQYIAVPAGLNSPIWPVTGGPARVYVYGLP